MENYGSRKYRPIGQVPVPRFVSDPVSVWCRPRLVTWNVCGDARIVGV